MQKPSKKRFLNRIEKQFRKGVATFAEDDSGVIERLPWGISQLDCLTFGGLPLGKITMFHGPESGSKTTMGVLSCAKYLERFPSKLAVYVDAEEKYPRQFAERLRYDKSRFVTADPETAEETIDFVETTLRDPSVGILVLDSIAAMVPKIEIDSSAIDQQQGFVAREVNKMVRKVVGAMKAARLKYGKCPTVILINQERFKIGVRFGDPVTLPGGEGQKYACSLRVRFRPMNARKEDEMPEDSPLIKVGATIMKHSFGPRGKGAEYFLAMKSFQGLHAGETRDEEFVRLISIHHGLIHANGKGWLALNKSFPDQDAIAFELLKRKSLYTDLKTRLLAKLKSIEAQI